MKVNLQKIGKQSGFTMIELLVTISIMVILAAVIVSVANPDKSKGDLLFTEMKQVGQAIDMYKINTSCYPVDTGSLVNPPPDSGETNLTWCGNLKTAPTWDGPYVKGATVNDHEKIMSTKFGSEVTYDIVRCTGKTCANKGKEQTNFEVNTNGVPSKLSDKQNYVFLIANSVPRSVAIRMVETCNQNKEISTDGGKRLELCAIKSGDDELTQVSMLVGQSRASIK